MLEQAGIQYGVNWTTLRAPWIMEKDDFKFALSFGPDQFGGPDWDTLISPATAQGLCTQTNAVPVLIAADGQPLKRNFVHLDDLVEAIIAAIDHPAARQQLFNIAMTEPVDYCVVGAHLHNTRGMRPVRIETPYISNLLDNAKARLRLGWAPKVDTTVLCDRAFAYERATRRRAQDLVPGLARHPKNAAAAPLPLATNMSVSAAVCRRTLMPEFKTRRVGKTTLEVTELGFGSATIAGMNGTVVTPDEARDVVGAALDAGIGYFDTAPHYGFGSAEHLVGDATAVPHRTVRALDQGRTAAEACAQRRRAHHPESLDPGLPVRDHLRLLVRRNHAFVRG